MQLHIFFKSNCKFFFTLINLSYYSEHKSIKVQLLKWIVYEVFYILYENVDTCRYARKCKITKLLIFENFT